MTSPGPSLPGLDAPPGTLLEVAIPVPLRRTFTYRLPAALGTSVAPGIRVAVPFGRRKVAGFVVGTTSEPPPPGVDVAPVAGVLDDEPPFPEELFAFLVEAADYYLHPLGEVLRAAAPTITTDALEALRVEGFLDDSADLGSGRMTRRKTWRLRLLRAPGAAPAPDDGRLGPRQRALLDALAKEGAADLDQLRGVVPDPRTVARSLERRGHVAIDEVERVVDPFLGPPVTPDVPPSLTEAQTAAVGAIGAAVAARDRVGFLLQGVTGSGKTEVYLRAIAACRDAGRGALVLVPEIALTPQLVARFRARFGDGLAVLHSGLGRRERDDAWRALRAGRVGLAVGARSALFAPVADLGLVVVDEEHDPSFKQEEGFRYHARDLALLRAHRAGAVSVLGSATPSLEARHLSDEGRLTRLLLPERATRQALPPVEIVDLTRHRSGPSGHALLSAPLHRALEEALARGGQAILFLNRRGFAPSLRCGDCGEVPGCPGCSVALTEHRRHGVLRCHYCDFQTPAGDACPACGALRLERIGLGTEQLEDALAAAFTEATVARLDRDTATSPRVLEALLDRFRRREVDILVGTQMVTKGHDLPGVTLVGVVLADQSLAFPDFRASERTFQLLAQVAGRAGRGEHPGRVIVQTFQPDHVAVRRAAAHDYEGFYGDELGARRELGYSPFSRLVAVRVDAADEGKAMSAVGALAEVARGAPDVRSGAVGVLGPAASPIARIRGRYRHRMFLRSSNRRALRAVARLLAGWLDGNRLAPARAHIDVDPVSML